ncbi:hypothetical protein MCEMAEM4_03389 [Burkholderiaceae bacterium]
MPAPPRKVAEAPAPNKLGVALDVRPLVMEPAVASSTKLPSASKMLTLMLRDATKLMEPVSAAFNDTKRWPSNITISRLASTEIKPCDSSLFCNKTSWPVELKRIKPVVLVTIAVLTTLPVACAVMLPPLATTLAFIANWLLTPPAESRT